jgi:hypothetical protein
MISSVVARVSSDFLNSGRISELVAHPGIEVGEIVGANSLPLSIEAATREEMMRIHDWIGSLHGVEWLDVVFVYLDQEFCPPTHCEAKQG